MLARRIVVVIRLYKRPMLSLYLSICRPVIPCEVAFLCWTNYLCVLAITGPSIKIISMQQDSLIKRSTRCDMEEAPKHGVTLNSIGFIIFGAVSDVHQPLKISFKEAG